MLLWTPSACWDCPSQIVLSSWTGCSEKPMNEKCTALPTARPTRWCRKSCNGKWAIDLGTRTRIWADTTRFSRSMTPWNQITISRRRLTCLSRRIKSRKNKYSLHKTSCTRRKNTTPNLTRNKCSKYSNKLKLKCRHTRCRGPKWRGNQCHRRKKPA